MVVKKIIKDGNNIATMLYFNAALGLKFSRYSTKIDTSSFEKSGRYSPCTHMHCRANMYVDVSG